MSRASVGSADDRFGRKIEQRSSNQSSSLDNFRFSQCCWTISDSANVVGQFQIQLKFLASKVVEQFQIQQQKKLESEHCWTISDSATSPTEEEELELWLQGKSKVFKGTAGIQRYIKLCKCTDL